MSIAIASPCSARQRMGPRLIAGLSDIAHHYEGFFIDQWGVLHDGRALFPGVAETLARLHAAGKRVVLLSNSGRRAAYNDRRLAEMGVEMRHLAGSLTSGEVAWRLLRERAGPPFSQLGRRCFLFTRFGDLGVVEGLDLELVEDVDQADFLFITGVDSPGKSLSDYLPVIERAAVRRIPAICSNPDRVAPVGDQLALAPGALAEAYERLGGPVIYLGKPSPSIFAAGMAELPGIARERILMVGDSMAHDIVGAKSFGIDACLILSGIHREAFADAGEAQQLISAACTLGERYKAMPDFLMHRLTW